MMAAALVLARERQTGDPPQRPVAFAQQRTGLLAQLLALALLSSSRSTTTMRNCLILLAPSPYMRNTPKLPTFLRSSGRHALLTTPSASPRTVRVSEGRMMPSSHLRAKQRDVSTEVSA